MQPKERPCKGTGLARGNGCGIKGFHNSMNKGLCPSCWSNWLLNTDEGKSYLERVQLKAKGQIKHTKRKEKTQSLRKLMTADAYRAKVLQPVVNEIVRLIDYEQPCIASGVTWGKFSAGHFTSVGSNRLIALNLHNIHIQAYHSNGPQGGQPIEYLLGLKKVYSEEYAEFILSLRSYKRQMKFNKADFEKAYSIATGIRSKMKKNPVVNNAAKRIELRNDINLLLGLYPDSIYQLKSTNNAK